VDIFQKVLNQQVSTMPAFFLEEMIAKKLREQGIKGAKGLSAELAKRALEGDHRPVHLKGGANEKNCTITLSEADIHELERKLNSFGETILPKMLPNLANRLAKSVLKDLKARWPEEEDSQASDLVEFQNRLRERWGTPLGQLKMLLTMAREWCEHTHRRENSRRRRRKKQLPQLLIRLLVRACQVTDEIICFLENGFADGAMARWRTLHEIAVVAAVISQHGEEIAEAYIAHQAVESKRAMDKYQISCQQLGYKPLSAREQKRITKAYDAAIAKYGKSFKSDYGWAASHLKNARPTFSDLETAAGRAEMRSYCQMATDNVHAGIKSMYVRLGLAGEYSSLLAGRSNAGLCDPGQNAAHTLTQLSVLVCLSNPNLDDLVIADMMRTLRDEIPRSFYAAEKQLERDHKAISAGRS
jgi:Family of unknown function (DUF5677)